MKPEAYRSLLDTEERHWWFRARRRIVMDVLEARLGPAAAGSPPRTLLDVGAGGGALSERLGRFGRIVAVERAPEAMQRLCQREGLAAVAGRLPSLPFRSGTFDLVTAFDVLEHIEDDVAAVCELARVLRHGGHFLGTVPAHPSLWSGHDEVHGHFRRYRPGELESRLEGAGFRVEFATPFQTLLLPAFVTQRWLSRLAAGPPAPPSRPPSLVNAILEAVFAVERRWVGRGWRLPVGSSHLVYARLVSGT